MTTGSSSMVTMDHREATVPSDQPLGHIVAKLGHTPSARRRNLLFQKGKVSLHRVLLDAYEVGGRWPWRRRPWRQCAGRACRTPLASA
jgi:hypothetical protein